MGARERIVQFQGAAVMADRFVGLPRFGEGDGHVLENPGVVGVVAESETVAGEGGDEIAHPLEGEGLVEIIEALGFARGRTQPIQDTTKETHEFGASPLSGGRCTAATT